MTFFLPSLSADSPWVPPLLSLLLAQFSLFAQHSSLPDTPWLANVWGDSDKHGNY